MAIQIVAAILAGVIAERIRDSGVIQRFLLPPTSKSGLDEIDPKLWGDGGGTSDGSDPVVPPETPQNNPPPIWSPPRKIYADGDPTPDRRLPVEVDNQTSTDVPNRKAISVKKAIADREYGQLIPSPTSNKRIKIRLNFNRDIATEVNKLQEDAIERFGVWHAARMTPSIADTEEYLEKASLWDAMCFVMPEKLKGFQGDLTLGFGFGTLAAYAEYFRVSSNNAFIGIIDTVPKGYEVKNIDIDTPKEVVPEQEALMEIYGSIGLAGLLGQIYMGYKVPKDLTRMPNPEQLEIAKEDLYNAAKSDEFKYRQSVGLLGEDEGVPSPVTIKEKIAEEIDKIYYDKIYSIAEHNAWFTRQFDAIAGQFPINIKIEDNDLIQVGEQPLQISLPNIAETLAELIKVAITSQSLTESSMQIMLRALIEGGADRQMNIQSHRLLESITDYLGYSTRKKSEKVQFAFNPFYPGKQGDKPEDNPGNDQDFVERLADALEPTEVEIDTEEIDDESNLEKNLTILLEAARIIKAQNYRSWDPTKFADLFKGLSAFVDGEPAKDGEKSDWDKFVEKVEGGFAEETTADATKPYGRNYDNRPKIRDRSKEPE